MNTNHITGMFGEVAIGKFIKFVSSPTYSRETN